jgi:hypothetical protein
MEDQLVYLERMINLGYSQQKALDAWENRKLSERKIVSPTKNRPAREFLSGSVKLKKFTDYLRETLNKEYWDDLIKGQHLEKLFHHFDSTQATAADALINPLWRVRADRHTSAGRPTFLRSILFYSTKARI